MYAVIDAGGKQERVQIGDRIGVELLNAGPGDDVSFVPKLVVDGERVVTKREPLEASKVSGRVVGLAKGPKIVGFTYKAKARGRRRYGHRQWYTTVEITAIDLPADEAKAAAPKARAAKKRVAAPAIED